MGDDLTDKQRRFVAEYLVDCNATQAAIRAGYSEKTAYSIGSENLTKPEIQAAIKSSLKKHLEAAGISVERVLKEYARISFLDIRQLFDENGNLKPVHELDDDTAAAIAGLEVEVRRIAGEADEELEGQPHGGALKRQHGATARLHKVKLCDKKGALDSIARHLGMFTDKTEISGPGGGPIAVAAAIVDLQDKPLDELTRLFTEKLKS